VLAALAVRLPELDRYVTIDESRWVGRSADFASLIQQRDLDNTFIVGHPGVTTMWLGSLGLGPEQVRAFSFRAGQTDVTRRDGYLEALVAARRALVLANAVALGGMLWLAWGLLGPGAATVGGLLLVLDPFLGAHSRLIHLDALLASFMTLAALSSLAFWRGGHWAYVVGAGLFSGLALLTKAPSVYLLAFVPALVLFELVRTGRWRSSSGYARLLGGLGVWLGVAWLVCLALWPALRLKPLAVLRQAADFAARNAGSERDNFFWGQPVEDPGPLFYPVALLFRATPLMLLGLALVIYAAVRWRRQLAAFWPLLLLGGYALGFLLFMTLGQKKFDRYELPVFPILDLLAGLGLWVGWCWMTERWGDGGMGRWGGGPVRFPDRPISPSPHLPIAAAVTALVLAIWPLAAVYPYHLAYYNPLVGGGAAAQRVLFVGWGEGLDRAAAHLNAKPILIEAPTVATAYHRVLQAHLNSLGALPLERAELADYIVTYVNSIQRNQKSELLADYFTGREPEYVVWINGIEYARVYPGPRLQADAESRLGRGDAETRRGS
jgi:hypothetical protein